MQAAPIQTRDSVQLTPRDTTGLVRKICMLASLGGGVRSLGRGRQREGWGAGEGLAKTPASRQRPLFANLEKSTNSDTETHPRSTQGIRKSRIPVETKEEYVALRNVVAPPSGAKTSRLEDPRSPQPPCFRIPRPHRVREVNELPRITYVLGRGGLGVPWQDPSRRAM